LSAPTALHAERLAAVTAVLTAAGARTVLDLGCGDGALLLRLASCERITRVIGVDASPTRLGELRAALRRRPAGEAAKVTLIEATLTAPAAQHAGFDAAVMVETLEHLAPERLGSVEAAVFDRMAPRTVVVTTPNADFNELLGVPAHRWRHPDHRFEWGRARFARWARGVADRHGYVAERRDIQATHPLYGGPSQLAVFTRRPGGSGRQVGAPPAPA